MVSDSQFALLVLLVIMAIAILAVSSQQPNYTLSNITKKKSANISLEIADNDLSRMRGLMFRPAVVPILFVFDSPGLFPIHSHFCPGEFDAVYVNEKGKVGTSPRGVRGGEASGQVVEIFRRVPVGLDLVSPKKTASYLLELPPELTDRLGIEEGDTVAWKELGK